MPPTARDSKYDLNDSSPELDVFMAMADGALLVRLADGVITRCNPAMARLLGRDRSWIIGRHQQRLYPPSEWADGFSRDFPRGEDQVGGQARQATMQSAQGREITVEVSYGLVRGGPDGLVVATVRRAIRRDEVEQRARLGEARLDALYRLNRMEYASVADIYDFILDEAVELTGSRYGYLFLMSDDERSLQLHSWSSKVREDCKIERPQSVFSVESAGLWGEAVRRRKACVHNDYESLRDAASGYPPGHVELTRHMNMPVFDGAGRRIMAVVGVANKPCDYTGDDVRQMSLLLHGMNSIIQKRDRAAQLAESRKRYKNLIEHLSDIILSIDTQGRLVYASKALGDLLGGQSGDWVGRNLNELPLGDFAVADLREAMARVARGAGAVETELDATVDGRPLVFNVRMFPERGESDQPERVIWVMRDITDHRQSENNYQMIFSRMLDAFAVHEMIYDNSGRPLDYRFVSVNPAFEAMTGLRASDIVGKTAREVVPDLDEHWVSIYGKVAKSGRPARFCSYSSGLSRHYEVLAFHTRHNHFACIFADVSNKVAADRKRLQLEQQLRQAQKMEAIGTLAGGIAHDFNNILSAMIGYTELAIEDLPLSHPSRECLEQVTTAGDRAKSLVRQILSFSRPTDEKHRPMHLRPIISEALKLLRSSIPTTVEISFEMSADNDLVMADPTQVHQLLMNLCTNASQAMGEDGGAIRVSLETAAQGRVDAAEPGAPRHGQVCLTVRDTGCGMDAETLTRVFEPFFSKRVDGQGTGMGLAVAHGIVSSHGGTIEAQSSPGEGSAFIVHLPLLPSAEEKAVIAPQAAMPVGDERILFVDDEEDLVEIGKRSLARLGYRVVAMTSSSEALRTLVERPLAFDLLITDYTMPGMTGMELARQAMKIRPELPVIICTGYSGVITPEKAAEAGIKRLVLKPLVVRQVAGLVREVLDQARRDAH